jgi:hypothetical protein
MRMFIYSVDVDGWLILHCENQLQLKCWRNSIKLCFELKYLQQPNKVNIEKQLQINHDCGFFKMFTSLDCMHYVWKNCLVSW